MAQTPRMARSISVTLTQRQVDWLNERQRTVGTPVSRAIRDALDRAYPEVAEPAEGEHEGEAA